MKRAAKPALVGFMLGVITAGAGALYIDHTPSSGQPYRRARAECSPFFHVRIGKHDFTIPREEAPVFTYSYPPTGGIGRGVIPCTAYKYLILKVHSFFLFPTLPGYPKDELRNGEGFAVNLQVGNALVQHSAQDDPVDRNAELLARGVLELGMNLADLPIEEGYYVLHRGGIVYLIPVDETFSTPSGDPVVFRCVYHGMEVGRLHKSLHCDTGFVWKDTMSVYVRNISSAWVPKTKLRDFYHHILAYLATMEKLQE